MLNSIALKSFALCFGLIFSIFSSCLFADDMEGNGSEMNEEFVFVSIGSYCEPAHMLRFCELRNVAFPFDWIISFDGDGLIEMLETNFARFFDREYFALFGANGHLLQTYYHLEFLHDGNFHYDYERQYALFVEKYQRRIERFRNLKNYQGKVFFIRKAYAFTMTDPHRYYRFEENLEISEENALRLYETLKSFFPLLDFDLLVINCCEESGVLEYNCVHQHLRMFRCNPHAEQFQKIEDYCAFFNELIPN